MPTTITGPQDSLNYSASAPFNIASLQQAMAPLMLPSAYASQYLPSGVSNAYAAYAQTAMGMIQNYQDQWKYLQEDLVKRYGSLPAGLQADAQTKARLQFIAQQMQSAQSILGNLLQVSGAGGQLGLEWAKFQAQQALAQKQLDLSAAGMQQRAIEDSQAQLNRPFQMFGINPQEDAKYRLEDAYNNSQYKVTSDDILDRSGTLNNQPAWVKDYLLHGGVIPKETEGTQDSYVSDGKGNTVFIPGQAPQTYYIPDYNAPGGGQVPTSGQIQGTDPWSQGSQYQFWSQPVSGYGSQAQKAAGYNSAGVPLDPATGGLPQGSQSSNPNNNPYNPALSLTGGLMGWKPGPGQYGYVPPIGSATNAAITTGSTTAPPASAYNSSNPTIYGTGQYAQYNNYAGMPAPTNQSTGIPAQGSSSSAPATTDFGPTDPATAFFFG